jgi:hypothetical protein
MPDVTGAHDPDYAGQGYDRAEHVEHLREALSHCEACVRHLGKAIDALQFDPDVDANPEG